MIRTSIALIICFCFSASALGQNPTDQQYYDLLSDNSVVTHLVEQFKLSEESKERIENAVQTANQDLRSEQREIMSGSREFTAAQREFATKELQQAREDIVSEAFEICKECLNKRQYNRIKSIAIQKSCSEMLTDPFFCEILEVSPQQSKKFVAIKKKHDDYLASFRLDLQKLMQDSAGDRRAMFNNFRSMQLEEFHMKSTLEKDVLKLLSKPQRKTWNRLTGKPFDFPSPNLGRMAW